MNIYANASSSSYMKNNSYKYSHKQKTLASRV